MNIRATIFKSLKSSIIHAKNEGKIELWKMLNLNHQSRKSMENKNRNKEQVEQIENNNKYGGY